MDAESWTIDDLESHLSSLGLHLAWLMYGTDFIWRANVRNKTRGKRLFEYRFAVGTGGTPRAAIEDAIKEWNKPKEVTKPRPQTLSLNINLEDLEL